MRSSSADIFWASDSQLSVHWLLMRKDTIIIRVEYLLENIIVMTNGMNITEHKLELACMQ